MHPPVPEVDVSHVPSDAAEPPYILDVREDDEWAAGHIETARHVPLSQVSGRLGEIPTGRQVYVVCRSGTRSARATEFLVRHGVDAVNVAGGMKAWQGAGRAMVSQHDEEPHVL